MRYPSKPPPAGLRIEPDVAAFPPRVSNDGKTYTFTLRKNARFSDGKPVQADAFARSISRMLIPGMNSPGAEYVKDIVGAEAVSAGTRTVPAGCHRGGNTARDQVHAADSRLSNAHDDAVLLRCPAGPAGSIPKDARSSRRRDRTSSPSSSVGGGPC